MSFQHPSESFRTAAQAASAQWDSLIPASCADEVRRVMISLVLANQDKMLKTLGMSGSTKAMVERLGRGGPITMLAALATALADTPLWRLVSIQPMLGPISSVMNYRVTQLPATVPPGIPEMRYDMESVDIVSHTRSLTRVGLDAAPIASFARALDAVTREVVGNLRAVATTKTNVPDLTTGGLDLALDRAAHMIHRLGQRGPANWVFVGPNMLSILKERSEFVRHESVLDDLAWSTSSAAENRIYFAGTYRRRYAVIVDSKFPPTEVLLGRLGVAPLDAAYIWAPYYFTSYDIANSDEISLVIRQATRLVKPDDYALLSV